MNKMLTQKEQEEIVEKRLANIEPDDSIDKKYFAASLTKSGLTVAIPLGVDIHFRHGINAYFGISPDQRLTVNLEQDEKSPYRLGFVDREDHMVKFPIKKIFIPTDKFRFQNKDILVPCFNRRHPDKIFYQRSLQLQLTFGDYNELVQRDLARHT